MTGGLRVLALIAVVLFSTVLLRECGFSGSKLYAALGAVCLIAVGIGGIGELAGELFKIGEKFNLDRAVTPAFKAVGIGLIFGIAADMCRDLGENGIASAVDFIGRAELAVLAIPLIDEIISVGVGLVNG